MQSVSSRHSAWAPLVVKLTIDPADPTRFGRTLMYCATLRRPRLLINCEHLPCLRTHGLGHFVSHLLLLRHTGAKILLHNVSPALYRHLRLLRLNTVFRVYLPVHSNGEEGTRWFAAA